MSHLRTTEQPEQGSLNYQELSGRAISTCQGELTGHPSTSNTTRKCRPRLSPLYRSRIRGIEGLTDRGVEICGVGRAKARALRSGFVTCFEW